MGGSRQDSSSATGKATCFLRLLRHQFPPFPTEFHFPNKYLCFLQLPRIFHMWEPHVDFRYFPPVGNSVEKSVGTGHFPHDFPPIPPPARRSDCSGFRRLRGYSKQELPESPHRQSQQRHSQVKRDSVVRVVHRQLPPLAVDHCLDPARLILADHRRKPVEREQNREQQDCRR